MAYIDPAFWRDRRVFVTGHTGFKGGWLVLWLHSLGAKVAGYALPPDTAPNIFDALHVETLCEHTYGDLAEAEKLLTTLAAFSPEIVIHMAAQPLVRLSYQQPVETFATNVMGSVTVLEACRSIGSVKAVINVTTDKVYENDDADVAFKETDALGGHDPYSASKACAELVTSAYRDSFFADPDCQCVIASARAGNVIGGGDWNANRLIPDAVRAFHANEPLVIRMPNAVRPWQHVLEPLQGYLLLAERCVKDGRAFGRAWNFGSGQDQKKTVSDIAARFAKEWSDDAALIVDEDQANLREANLLQLDSSQAAENLGWHPCFDTDTILNLTATWYRAYHNDAGVTALRDLSLEQISLASGAA